MVGQVAAQVVQTGLAGTVGESIQRRHPESINTTDVDDAGGVLRARRLLQQGRHKLGQVENTVEVQGQDASPGGRRVFIVRRTPVGARVVNEDVEL